MAAVTNAWHAVGLSQPYTSNVVADFTTRDTVVCPQNAKVSFFNNSTNGYVLKWYFGDGDSSADLSPTHFYKAVGSYNVTLIADGGSCGIDTLVKSMYVTVSPTGKCTYDVLDTNVISDCSGVLYDDGGSDKLYGTNINDTIH